MASSTAKTTAKAAKTTPKAAKSHAAKSSATKRSRAKASTTRAKRTGTTAGAAPKLLADREQRGEHKVTQYLLEAHAMELMQVQALTGHIAITPAGRYRTHLETHLGETRRHAERIQKHLARREQGPGIVQSGYGVAQGVMTQVMALSKLPVDMVRGMSGEEKLLKNARDECATEAQEIAMYLAIEQLASRIGDTTTANLAASIRADEEAMLEVLLAQVPTLAADLAIMQAEGRSQYDVRRIGAVDAARTVAGSAARTVARTASRTARRADEPGPVKRQSRTARPQGAATVSAKSPRRAR